MIIHKKKTITFLILIVSLVMSCVILSSSTLSLAMKILFPTGCAWLAFYMLTHSLKIDGKGIGELYALFQKELWVVRFIEWKNIERVSFDAGPRSLAKNTISIFPKNRNVTLWDTNVIGVNTAQYDREEIVALLLKHGVALPPELT